MAMLLVKNRIHINETEAVDFILKSKNPRALLTFLYDFQNHIFVKRFKNSGERASLVIQDG